VANAAPQRTPNTYNILVGNNAYYDPLVIRTTDVDARAYNNGTFTLTTSCHAEPGILPGLSERRCHDGLYVDRERTYSSTIYAGIDATPIIRG
jgi:hypothetical protein